MPSYLFIVNPVSGRGKAARVVPELEGILKERDVRYQIAHTEFPRHAEELARQAGDAFDVLVVVGGDGTLNEVLNGCIGKSCAVGILPVGSGNDFVRAIPISAGLQPALDILLTDHRKKIDLARVNERIYHNGVGIGFDAQAVHTGNQVKWLRGNAIYLYAVFHTLLHFKPSEVTLKFNGQTYSRNYFIMNIANGVALGGGFRLTPDALLDDGFLDLCLVRDMPLPGILRNLLKVYKGRHKDDPRVEMYRTKQISIESEEGFAVHADGELLSLNMKKVDIKILPKAIELVC